MEEIAPLGRRPLVLMASMMPCCCCAPNRGAPSLMPDGARERADALCARIDPAPVDIDGLDTLIQEAPGAVSAGAGRAGVEALPESHARDTGLTAQARQSRAAAIAEICRRLALEMEFRFCSMSGASFCPSAIASITRRWMERL